MQVLRYATCSWSHKGMERKGVDPVSGIHVYYTQLVGGGENLKSSQRQPDDDLMVVLWDARDFMSADL